MEWEDASGGKNEGIGKFGEQPQEQLSISWLVDLYDT